jgi:hypothetical protein
LVSRLAATKKFSTISSFLARNQSSDLRFLAELRILTSSIIADENSLSPFKKPYEFTDVCKNISYMVAEQRMIFKFYTGQAPQDTDRFVWILFLRASK